MGFSPKECCLLHGITVAEATQILENYIAVAPETLIAQPFTNEGCSEIKAMMKGINVFTIWLISWNNL